MTTTPDIGFISLANVRSTFGLPAGPVSLGALRGRHPVAALWQAGTVSMSGLRGVGANVTAWCDATTLTGNVWVDKSVTKNSVPVTRGNAVLLTSSNNGVVCLTGGTGDGLKLPVAATPAGARYTLFHVARHTIAPRGRIFDGIGANWLSGFHGNKSGVAHHNAWLTGQTDVHGTNWVVSADQWSSYRSNKIDRKIVGNVVAANFQVTVNHGAFFASEPAAWECAEVATFDRLMGNAEIMKVESYLAEKHYTELPPGADIILHAKDVPLSAGRATPTTGGNLTAQVAAWTGTTFAQATFANAPIVSGSGGYADGPTVTFTRAASQHVAGGSKTFNITTGGGLTVVTTFRFTGAVGTWERIFDFGNGPDAYNVYLSRYIATNRVVLSMYTQATGTTRWDTFIDNINQDAWYTIAFKYNRTAATMQTYMDNQLIATQTGVFAQADRTLSNTYIGRSNYAGNDYLNGNIKTLLVYDRALTDTEMYTAYLYSINTGLVNDTLTPPATPVVQLDAAVPSRLTVSGGPLAYTYGGYANGPYLSLVRSSSQHLVSSSNQTWNTSTNGGFTAVVFMRFTGTASGYERVFDIGDGPAAAYPSNNFLMYRNNGSTVLGFSMNNAGVTTGTVLSPALTAVQNEWAVFTCRYTKATTTMAFYKNNILIASTGSVATLNDRTVVNAYIGRSLNTADVYLNADIRWFAAYDRSLSDAEMTQAYEFCVGQRSDGFPATPKIYVDAAALVPQTSRGSVPIWYGYGTGLGAAASMIAGSTVPPTIAMAYNDDQQPVIRFSRDDSQHYVASASQTFNMTTNGGFTAMVHMRFTGTAASWERIFDFANLDKTLNVYLGRNLATTALQFGFVDAGVTTTANSATGVIVQDEWAVFTVVYNLAAATMTVYKNNVASGTPTSSVTGRVNRTINTCYIGRSHYALSGDAYLNGDIRALYVWDRALTSAEMNGVYAGLLKDQFTPSPVIRSLANVKLWLDAEYNAKFQPSTSTTWVDLSPSAANFTLSSAAALSNVGGINYMNFSAGTSYASRSPVVPLVLPASTIVAFTSVLNGGAGTFRTLSRSDTGVHHVLVDGNNIIGEWFSGGKFSTYNITNIPNVYSKMNMLAVRLSNSSAQPWELLIAPMGNVQSVANVVNVVMNNSVTHGIGSIGGHYGSQPWGNIASFLYFDRHLTIPELQTVYNDQCKRYGLSGVYEVTLEGSAAGTRVQCFKDMDTDGGGWTLVLNYVHLAGTNPAQKVRATTDGLPLLKSATLGADESATAQWSYGGSWGHAGTSLMSALPTFTEVRFYGRTSGHSRILHFKTSLASMVSYVRTGAGTVDVPALKVAGTGHTTLAGHTAFLPASADATVANQGDYAMTNQPFYLADTYNWNSGGFGFRWEVDDNVASGANSTIHQVWVR